MLGKLYFSYDFLKHHLIANDRFLFENQEVLDELAKKNLTWQDEIEAHCQLYLRLDRRRLRSYEAGYKKQYQEYLDACAIILKDFEHVFFDVGYFTVAGGED